MTNNPIPENLQTDHLFLLIGTNPLPNYVAAKLLLKEKGQFYLVHSVDTREATDRLQVLLKKKEIAALPPRKVEVEEADAVDIYDKIKAVAREINSGSVGLNYTGGTKVMAVQSHQAVQDAVRENGLPNAVFSYLDARKYQMKFEPVGTSRPPRQKVLLAVNLGLEDLLGLHEIILKDGLPTKEYNFLKTASELISIHKDKDTAKKWRNWCENELKPKVWSIRSKESKLKKVNLVWPLDSDLQSVINNIYAELNLPNSDVLNLGEPQITNKFSKVKYFCEWLDGKWLEHYVLAQVEEVAAKCNLYDYGMGLDTDENKISLDFEFDIAAMRGYQLFGISCSSTFTKSLAKSKLFEAYIRARQLGGDEARIGLVCAYPSPRELETELEKSWNSPGVFRVFGPSHFSNLKDHLAHWFTEADRQ